MSDETDRRSAVITGAAQGLGADIARRLRRMAGSTSPCWT